MSTGPRLLLQPVPRVWSPLVWPKPLKYLNVKVELDFKGFLVFIELSGWTLFPSAFFFSHLISVSFVSVFEPFSPPAFPPQEGALSCRTLLWCTSVCPTLSPGFVVQWLEKRFQVLVLLGFSGGAGSSAGPPAYSTRYKVMCFSGVIGCWYEYI